MKWQILPAAAITAFAAILVLTGKRNDAAVDRDIAESERQYARCVLEVTGDCMESPADEKVCLETARRVCRR